jgi:hypothetical protein
MILRIGTSWPPLQDPTSNTGCVDLWCVSTYEEDPDEVASSERASHELGFVWRGSAENTVSNARLLR